MARSETCTAIVLHVYDVGEADRYCILFTRERGRIAARARAVRKTASRIGGSILPLQHINVTMSEGNAGYLIIGALATHTIDRRNVHHFLRGTQAADLLLQTLQDEEPMPELFDALAWHVKEGVKSDERSTAFALFTAATLGLLPSSDTEEFFGQLSPEGHTFVTACMSSEWKDVPVPPTDECARLLKRILMALEHHALRSFRSQAVAASMMG